jgi:serine/threonine-protein kinase
VLHQLGVGSLGPVFRGEDPDRREPVLIQTLRVTLDPAQPAEVAADLKAVARRIPSHVALATIVDAGVVNDEVFVVHTFVPGESLDKALAEYGPAAIADAVPRLRTLAEALDVCAGKGIWHGALTPRDIYVSAEDTMLVGMGVASTIEQSGVWMLARAPYSAPEIVEGGGSSRLSDQFALAAIAHEWLFGRRISGPALGRSEIPSLPGVVSDRLATALATALAADPARRFASCVAFVEAIAASLTSAKPSPDLPVAQLATRRSKDTLAAPVAALLPLDQIRDVAPADPPSVDLPLSRASAPLPASAETLRDAPFRHVSTDTPSASVIAPVSWQGSFIAPATEQQSRVGYGLGAIALALIVGLTIGAVAGYWFSGRENAGITESTVMPGVTEPVTPTTEQVAPALPPGSTPTETTEQVLSPPDDSKNAASQTTASRSTPGQTEPSQTAPAVPASRPTALARLLIRTTPAGATVTVDGVERGVTPLALRDLEFGTRSVVIARAGYSAAEQRITLTADRPSRSVDVRLTPVRAAAAPARPVPAPSAVPGSLVIMSRPPGAAVSIDGRASGITPLTLNTISPGEHRIRLERSGYQPWTTTIKVVSGERARIAASLVGGQFE